MSSATFTRRELIAIAAGAAAVSALRLPAIASAKAASQDNVAHGLRALTDRYDDFIEIDTKEIRCADDLNAWQLSYDRLVGAADAVRETITDGTPDRDSAIEYARLHVMPSCERALCYWLASGIMSDGYSRLAGEFFAARTNLACCLAQSDPREDAIELSRLMLAPLRRLQTELPRNAHDRIALRRVIETLNNDDMVDVAIARTHLEDFQVRSFRSWARPCGSFTCELCESWLGKHEEHA